MRFAIIVLAVAVTFFGCVPITEETEESTYTAPVETGSGIASGVSGELPSRIRESIDGHRLVTGAGERGEFYNISTIRRIDLVFTQSDWWDQMRNNYYSEEDIAADMSVDGIALADPVGVRFKGETSYLRNPYSKKSFNISLDFGDSEQKYMGYQELNLNCAFEDDSFMRELVFEEVIQYYIPAVANNYVELYLNGEYWGIYVSSQQLDGDFIKEWFLSNNGTRWRAEPEGTGLGNPGTGTSSLNYLGDDQSDYEPHYTLKKAVKSNPWSDLITTCKVLDETSSSAYTDISAVLDVDRSLWFLACENVFADDDSYIHKGGTDYFIYWEAETGRMTPLEYDGNSCLSPGNIYWSPFYNATSSRYPLLYKLLAVPHFRQRYLAHLRTILDERLNADYMDSLIEEYAARIDAYIQADPKKMMTYDQYLDAVSDLKTLVRTRHEYLMSNEEVGVDVPQISDTSWSVDGSYWAAPDSSQAVLVTATVACTEGIEAVYLYGATGVVGNFSTISMKDDGEHGDGSAGDGVYGCTIPAQTAGTRVRFYIEAVAADSINTLAYDPAGAEHDVYTYVVQ